MIDKKMLLELFHNPSPSGEEEFIQDYIKKFLDENKFPYEEDIGGNIFSFIGTKPFLSAHMDTVQDRNDVALAPFIKIRGNVLSGYGVIGGDDKCGIYIILHLLKEGYDINFSFSVQEEVGGIGANMLALSERKKIKESLYGLILDRKGSQDIICDLNNYGTKKFEDALVKIGSEFGYSPNRGSFSDADQFNDIISCANLSVGYHNPHNKTEFVHISQLENSLNYVRTIISEIKEKFEPPKVYNYSSYGKTKNKKNSYPYYYGDDLYDDDDYYNDYYSGTYKKNKCSFCEKDTKADLEFLPSLNKYICHECILKFYEDTYKIAQETLLNEEELDELISSFK
jgi:tripeptide aminopeptidase